MCTLSNINILRSLCTVCYYFWYWWEIPSYFDFYAVTRSYSSHHSYALLVLHIIPPLLFLLFLSPFSSLYQTSHGTVDARDSSISSLQHQLRTEQARTKELEKQVPSLESQISTLQDELKSTQHTLEEKTSSLAQARKHLRNSRERNMVGELYTECYGTSVSLLV